MRPRVALAILAILPAAGLAAYFLAGDVVTLTDPCHEWASGRGATGGSGSVGPDDACQRRSGSSQTLGEYLFMMLWVKGGILAGCVLGALGVARRRRGLAVAGAALLALVGVPLMLGGTGVVLWASAALVLVGAFALR